MTVSILTQGAAFALIALFPHPLVVALVMLCVGIANAPYDIVMFTLRQRRTDPAWLGRAFAVSMGLNFIGFPIGSAISGLLAPISIPLVLAIAATAEVAAAIVAYAAIPAEDSLA
jgi:hypothetical protein